MAKEFNLEIPVVHEYDKTLDKNICKVRVNEAFKDILKLFLVDTGTIGYSTKAIGVEGSASWVSRTRYKIKNALATDAKIRSLPNYEWLLGRFFDTEYWTGREPLEISFEVEGLREYYTLTGSLQTFFESLLNIAAAMKVQITHTYVAKFKE